MKTLTIRLTDFPEHPSYGPAERYQRQEDALLEHLISASEDGRIEMEVASIGGVIGATITVTGSRHADPLALLPDGYRGETVESPGPRPAGATAVLVRRLAVVDHPDDGNSTTRLAWASARRTAGRARRREFLATPGNSEVIACAPAVWPLRRLEPDDDPRRWLRALAHLGDAAVVVTVAPVPDAERAAASDVFAALRAVADRPGEETSRNTAARLIATTAAKLSAPTSSVCTVMVTARAGRASDARGLLRAWAAARGLGSVLRVTTDEPPPWKMDGTPPLADQLRAQISSGAQAGWGASEFGRLTRLLERLYTAHEVRRLLGLPAGPARGLTATPVCPYPPAGRPNEFDSATTALHLGYVGTPQLMPCSGPEATPDNPLLRGAAKLSIPPQSLYGHGAITGGTGRGKGHFLEGMLRQWLQDDRRRLTLVDTGPAEHYRLLAPHAGGRLLRLRPLYAKPAGTTKGALAFDIARVPTGVPVQMHVSLLMPGLAALFNCHATLAGFLERGVRSYYLSNHPLACGLNNSTLGGPHLLKFDANGNAKPGLLSLCDYFLNVYIPANVGSLGSAKEAEYQAYFSSRWENLRDGPLGEMCAEADAHARRNLAGKKLDANNLEHQFWYDLFTEVQARSAVIELETLPGDDERAAVIMFLLAFFQMHLWAIREREGGRPRALEHLLVLEEAHRVAGPTSGGGRGEASGESPQARALRLLLTALLEFRKYGLGVLMVTPSATGLDERVVNAVDFQVAFRTSGARDRRFLADTLGCSPEESRYLSRLDRGNAVVRCPTLPRPVLIVVPNGPFADEPAEPRGGATLGNPPRPG